MQIYEYLFAGLILIAMLLASSIIVTTMSNPQLSASDKEEVKVEAEKIMTQILLDAGQPYDWGSDTSIDQTNLQDFGLAKYGESTREAYVLDPDNVQRLDSDLIQTNLYIPPSVAATLLNLVNIYGFTLDIHPVLNVTVTPVSAYRYSMTVTSEYQTIPIVNAQINATLFYYNAATGIINSKTAASLTGFDGRCILDFSGGPANVTGILAISAYYLGIRSVKTYPVGNLERAFLIGDNILLKPSFDIASTNITEVIATQQSGQYIISSFNSTASNNSSQNYQLAFDEPTVFAVLAPSSDYQTLIYASRNIDLTYSTIPQIATSPISSPLLSYSLERTAMIGDTAYTVTLMLWRMSY